MDYTFEYYQENEFGSNSFNSGWLIIWIVGQILECSNIGSLKLQCHVRRHARRIYVDKNECCKTPSDGHHSNRSESDIKIYGCGKQS